MSGFPGAGCRLMIVDDDEMTREVLALMVVRAGFAAEVYPSGAAALEGLSGREAAERDGLRGILADLQMPGPAGESFARQARAACGEGAVLLAMSATAVGKGELRGYDGFLRKPFSLEALCGALESAAEAAALWEAELAPVLRSMTLAQLCEDMAPERLRELYSVFLADAEMRLATMRDAAERGDGTVWRGAAHQLKGSCGMVGAAEMAELAGAWEARGVPGSGDSAPIEELDAALARLRRVLAARLP